MPSIVIVGAQWGDEGKGKVTDLLAERADAVIRFQGGNNAGHTIVRDGETFKLHLIPVGDPAPRQAVRHRQRRGDRPARPHGRARRPAAARHRRPANLRISANAHLIMPYHLLLDDGGRAEAGRAGDRHHRRGIGPCYADKAARLGIRMQDLLDEKILRKKITAALEPKRLTLRPHEQGPQRSTCTRWSRTTSPTATASSSTSPTPPGWSGTCSTPVATSLFEGAQGALLDIDHGTYPFVTSSNPVAGAACVGAGVGPKDIDEVWGVAKAYQTRVGSGPFPTELDERPGRRPCASRGARVRHHHRPAAAHRLARPRRAALRRAHQLADGAGDHQARRALRPGADLPVCTALPQRARAPSSTLPLPPVRAAPRVAAARTRTARLGRGHRRRAQARRPARRRRGAYLEFIAEFTRACRSPSIGVGPGARPGHLDAEAAGAAAGSPAS